MSGHAFKSVFQIGQSFLQTVKYRLLRRPQPAASSLNQPAHQSACRMRIERAKPLEHLLIKNVSCSELVIDPLVNRVGSRRPTKRVGYVMLDLGDPAETVAKHAFEPFRTQHLGPP